MTDDPLCLDCHKQLWLHTPASRTVAAVDIYQAPADVDDGLDGIYCLVTGDFHRVDLGPSVA